MVSLPSSTPLLFCVENALLLCLSNQKPTNCFSTLFLFEFLPLQKYLKESFFHLHLEEIHCWILICHKICLINSSWEVSRALKHLNDSFLRFFILLLYDYSEILTVEVNQFLASFH